jgi:hypothetical protein
MRGFKMGSFPWGGWVIENGTLKTLPEGDHIDIITTEQYKNFELELEWKVSAGGNSGIFHHGTETNYAIWQSAPEMQVLDDGVHHDGKNTKTSAGCPVWPHTTTPPTPPAEGVVTCLFLFKFECDHNATTTILEYITLVPELYNSLVESAVAYTPPASLFSPSLRDPKQHRSGHTCRL